MEKHPLQDIIKEIHFYQDDLIEVIINRKDLDIELFYFQSLTNLKHFNDFYLDKITKENYFTLSSIIPGVFSYISEYTLENINYLLNRGNPLILINKEVAYVMNFNDFPKRPPQKSELDPTNLFDSHDGFIESVNDNLALIRKRLKNSDLVVKKFVLGKNTLTDVYLIYLKKIKDAPFIKNITSKLEFCKKEDFLNINDINDLFNSSKFLPTVFNTSSPDYGTSAILEERALIIMDNSPVATILPATFSMFTSVKNESNEPKYYTFFSRLFSCLFFFLSIFSVGLFIALINFNPTFFSTLFMANIQLNERGTTFPLFIESMIVLFLFEAFRLISSTSPNNYVQNIIVIFSGLFIGQNAINSGLVGPSILFLTSISYVSAFALTNNQHLITSINIFRLFCIILSYTLGLFGFSISLVLIFLYLASINSSGKPYFLPFSPLYIKGIKNYFFPKHGGPK